MQGVLGSKLRTDTLLLFSCFVGQGVRKYTLLATFPPTVGEAKMSHYKEMKIGREVTVAIPAIAKNQGLLKWARDFLHGLSRNFPGMPGEV